MCDCSSSAVSLCLYTSLMKLSLLGLSNFLQKGLTALSASNTRVGESSVKFMIFMTETNELQCEASMRVI